MPNYVRIACSGKTIDGREISAAHLREMAASYDPDTYTALINIEHIRSFMPEGNFQNYGKVLALKTEDGDGKTYLLAVLDPTTELKKLNEKRQKIFTSVEITVPFADTKKAYLTGLAVTNSPASLGTEELKFNAQKTDGKLFSSYTDDPIALDSTEDTSDNTSDALLDKIKAFFNKNDDTQQASAQKATQSAMLALAAETAAALSAHAETVTATDTALKSLQADYDQLSSDFKALTTTLSETPTGTQRGEITGSADRTKTDC